MTSYILVIGDREALGWILTARRMAFPSAGRAEVAALTPGDELFLYTTRGCFKNPTRDRGRFIATASVTSPLAALDKPVHFADREFPVGCTLDIGPLAPLGRGVELAPLTGTLDAFRDFGSSWSIVLRKPPVRLGERDASTVRRLLTPLVEASSSQDYAAEYARWWFAKSRSKS